MRWSVGKLCIVTVLLSVTLVPAFDLHAAVAAAQPGDTISIPAGNYYLDTQVEIAKDLNLVGGPSTFSCPNRCLTVHGVLVSLTDLTFADARLSPLVHHVPQWEIDRTFTIANVMRRGQNPFETIPDETVNSYTLFSEPGAPTISPAEREARRTRRQVLQKSRQQRMDPMDLDPLEYDLQQQEKRQQKRENQHTSAATAHDATSASSARTTLAANGDRPIASEHSTAPGAAAATTTTTTTRAFAAQRRAARDGGRTRAAGASTGEDRRSEQFVRSEFIPDTRAANASLHHRFNTARSVDYEHFADEQQRIRRQARMRIPNQEDSHLHGSTSDSNNDHSDSSDYNDYEVDHHHRYSRSRRPSTRRLLQTGAGGGLPPGTHPLSPSAENNPVILSSYSGGCVVAVDCELTITRCVFQNCSALEGGGLFVQNTPTVITGSTFSDNTAMMGAGIFTLVASELTVSDTTFTNNIVATSTHDDVEDLWSNHTAYQIFDGTYGGACYLGAGIHSFTNTRFVNNVAYVIAEDDNHFFAAAFAGAIFANLDYYAGDELPPLDVWSSLYLSGVSFINNSAIALGLPGTLPKSNSYGGALRILSLTDGIIGNITMLDVQAINNLAFGWNPPLLGNGTWENALARGGFVYGGSGSLDYLVLADCVFDGNTAASSRTAYSGAAGLIKFTGFDMTRTSWTNNAAVAVGVTLGSQAGRGALDIWSLTVSARAASNGALGTQIYQILDSNFTDNFISATLLAESKEHQEMNLFGGAISMHAEDLDPDSFFVMRNCRYERNSATAITNYADFCQVHGAGVYVSVDGSRTYFTSSTFIDNTAVSSGSAICSVGGAGIEFEDYTTNGFGMAEPVVVSDCVFTGNTATFDCAVPCTFEEASLENLAVFGGAISKFGPVSLSVANTQLTNNKVSAAIMGGTEQPHFSLSVFGAGVYAASEGLTYTGGTVDHNVLDLSCPEGRACSLSAIGGGIFLENITSLLLDGMTIQNNSVVANTSSVPQLTGPSKADGSGGGIAALGIANIAYSYISGCTVADNAVLATTSAVGGGLFLADAEMHLNSSKFLRNSVLGISGSLSAADVIASTASSDEASMREAPPQGTGNGFGGGIALVSTVTLVAEGVELTGNLAGQAGGGLYGSASVTCEMFSAAFDNCDILDNAANIGGGVYLVSSATPNLKPCANNLIPGPDQVQWTFNSSRMHSNFAFDRQAASALIVVSDMRLSVDNASSIIGGNSAGVVMQLASATTGNMQVQPDNFQCGTGGLEFSDEMNKQVQSTVLYKPGQYIEFLNLSLYSYASIETLLARTESRFVKCSTCPSQQYSLLVGGSKTGKVCQPCPARGNCSNGGADLWATPQVWGAVKEKSVNFYLCPKGYCCGKGDQCSSYNYCTTNRTGILCSDCLPQHSLAIGSAVCVPDSVCNDIAWVAPLVIIMAAVIAGCYVYYALWDLADERATLSGLNLDAPCLPPGLGFTFLNFYQSLPLLLPADNISANADAFFNIFNLQVPQFGGALCIIPGLTAIGKIMITLLAPLLFVIFAVSISVYLSRRDPSKCRGLITYVVLKIGNIMYSALLNGTTLTLLQCTAIDGVLRLSIQAEIECYTTWQAFVIVLLIPFFFYPLFIYRRVMNSGKALRGRSRAYSTGPEGDRLVKFDLDEAFLVAVGTDFARTHKWWLPLTLLRRLLLSLFNAFIISQWTLRLSNGVVSIIALCLQLVYQPMANRYSNFLETGALTLLAAVSLFAVAESVMTNTLIPEMIYRDALSGLYVLFVVIGCIPLFVSFLVILHYLYQRHQYKKGHLSTQSSGLMLAADVRTEIEMYSSADGTAAQALGKTAGSSDDNNNNNNNNGGGGGGGGGGNKNSEEGNLEKAPGLGIQRQNTELLLPVPEPPAGSFVGALV